ncbi:MAG: ATP-binding cassette domain-containing protein [Oscillospiraceae bacterium]|nr:ATP-binding cassette domain-containing protein [Oscillospiraceae bacterium]
MIEIKHVCKDFGDGKLCVHAVDDVSLNIATGDIFGVIGFSGAGKSTLVRCINLLERPDSGSVVIDGTEMTALRPAELREARKKIGMIFQHFNLMPSRTVAENVAYPLKGSGLSRQEVRDRVRQLLKLVELEEKENAYPSQLSGGQKQRVAIARALANDPKVLLCDEATSALDPQTTRQILKLLKNLNQSLGITVVLITHEMAVVKEICTHVAVMDHGQVVEQGDVYSVFASPRMQITQNFIRTTSNLHKVDELIEEHAKLTDLEPGQLIVRLSYYSHGVSEPVISYLSRTYNVDINIIFANVEILQDSQLGGTVAIISGERENVTKAIEYFIEKNVGVEVLKDARYSA